MANKQNATDIDLKRELLDMAGVPAANRDDAAADLDQVLEAAAHIVSAHAKAPKAKAMNDELAAVEHHAHELRKTLVRLSGHSRAALWVDGELSEYAGVNGVGHREPESALTEYRSALKALEAAAVHAERPTRSGPAVQLDKHNLYDICARFFRNHSPHLITDDANGAFSVFLSRVYQEAAGEETSFRRIIQQRRT